MQRYSNEADRLDALASYDLLDTPRERDFDEVAELASKICETPIAVVNLVAEGRQFFKAEVGLGVRETPLDSSFCAKAILEEEFLMIPDAAKDLRFQSSPLVTAEQGLRFYAGALLRTADGHAIGTVCVLDYKPRSLTEVQEFTLRVLAHQVMRQIELRRVLRERDAAQAQQDLLNNEIMHRMKNMLAMVQAIASQTLRGVSERDAVDAFSRRLGALASAHDQLLAKDWSSADIALVARLQAQVHGDGRIVIDGPPVALGPKSTLSLSLVLHELATNAAKYGALSAPEGRVDLSWSVEDGEAGPELVMIWRESGGPKVIEPATTGFGTRLIRMGVAGSGGVEKKYLPQGFVAKFRASLAEINER